MLTAGHLNTVGSEENYILLIMMMTITITVTTTIIIIIIIINLQKTAILSIAHILWKVLM